MGVEGPHELELQLVDQGAVAVDLLEHGIDDESFPARFVGEQVGVGRSILVKELSKQHASSPLERVGDEAGLLRAPEQSQRLLLAGPRWYLEQSFVPARGRPKADGGWTGRRATLSPFGVRAAAS